MTQHRWTFVDDIIGLESPIWSVNVNARELSYIDRKGGANESRAMIITPQLMFVGAETGFGAILTNNMDVEFVPANCTVTDTTFIHETEVRPELVESTSAMDDSSFDAAALLRVFVDATNQHTREEKYGVKAWRRRLTPTTLAALTFRPETYWVGTDSTSTYSASMKNLSLALAYGGMDDWTKPIYMQIHWVADGRYDNDEDVFLLNFNGPVLEPIQRLGESGPEIITQFNGQYNLVLSGGLTPQLKLFARTMLGDNDYLVGSTPVNLNAYGESRNMSFVVYRVPVTTDGPGGVFVRLQTGQINLKFDQINAYQLGVAIGIGDMSANEAHISVFTKYGGSPTLIAPKFYANSRINDCAMFWGYVKKAEEGKFKTHVQGGSFYYGKNTDPLKEFRAVLNGRGTNVDFVIKTNTNETLVEVPSAGHSLSKRFSTNTTKLFTSVDIEATVSNDCIIYGLQTNIAGGYNLSSTADPVLVTEADLPAVVTQFIPYSPKPDEPVFEFTFNVRHGFGDGAYDIFKTRKVFGVLYEIYNEQLGQWVSMFNGISTDLVWAEHPGWDEYQFTVKTPWILVQEAITTAMINFVSPETAKPAPSRLVTECIELLFNASGISSAFLNFDADSTRFFIGNQNPKPVLNPGARPDKAILSIIETHIPHYIWWDHIMAEFRLTPPPDRNAPPILVIGGEADRPVRYLSMRKMTGVLQDFYHASTDSTLELPHQDWRSRQGQLTFTSPEFNFLAVTIAGELGSNVSSAKLCHSVNPFSANFTMGGERSSVDPADRKYNWLGRVVYAYAFIPEISAFGGNTTEAIRLVTRRIVMQAGFAQIIKRDIIPWTFVRHELDETKWRPLRFNDPIGYNVDNDEINNETFIVRDARFNAPFNFAEKSTMQLTAVRTPIIPEVLGVGS